MAAIDNNIRRLDQFACCAYLGFQLNPATRMALEDYCHKKGYDNHAKAEFLARIAYNTADIFQIESMTRVIT